MTALVADARAVSLPDFLFARRSMARVHATAGCADHLHLPDFIIFMS